MGQSDVATCLIADFGREAQFFFPRKTNKLLLGFSGNIGRSKAAEAIPGQPKDDGGLSFCLSVTF